MEERFDIDVSYRDPMDRPDGELYADRPSPAEYEDWCWTCEGAGYDEDEIPCPACHGSGRRP